MKCPKCNHIIPDDSKYCPDCGKKIEYRIGQLVIPCIYDWVGSFSNGLVRIKHSDKYGFIDTSGKLVVPSYDDAQDFSEGYARVEQNGKLGFIDTKGQLVIPCIYDWVGSFSDGFAVVEQNHKFGSISK